MRKSCFSLACLSFVLLTIVSQCLVAQGSSNRKYLKNRSVQKPDFSDPPYLNQIGGVSPKILSRHKRIKKSISPMNNHFVTLSDLKAVQRYGKLEKTSHKYSKNGEQFSTNKKKPLIVTKREPYLPKGLKTSNLDRKSNLKLNKVVKMGYPKKFKRSLSYNDFSDFDFRTERHGMKMPERFYKNNRRIKMKGGDKFYSLDEAKNELDRRRRLIRKLEKKINFKKTGLPNYATRSYYSDKNFLQPTIESIKDKLSTHGLMKLKDSKMHKTYRWERQQLPADVNSVKTKTIKANVAKKSLRIN